MTLAMTVKAAAEEKAQSAEQKKKEAENLRLSLDKEIKAKAKEITVETRLSLEKTYDEKRKNLEKTYDKKNKDLEQSHNNRTAFYYGYLVTALLYGILVTVFTGVNNSFRSAFTNFFKVLYGLIKSALSAVIFVANKAALLGDMIPQPIVAWIVHWLVLIIVAVILGGIPLVLLFIGGATLLEKYFDDFADKISLWVALISLAVVVFFADMLAALPINLFLLLILSHAAYIAVRWFRQSR